MKNAACHLNKEIGEGIHQWPPVQSTTSPTLLCLALCGCASQLKCTTKKTNNPIGPFTDLYHLPPHKQKSPSAAGWEVSLPEQMKVENMNDKKRKGRTMQFAVLCFLLGSLTTAFCTFTWFASICNSFDTAYICHLIARYSRVASYIVLLNPVEFFIWTLVSYMYLCHVVFFLNCFSLVDVLYSTCLRVSADFCSLSLK